MADGEIIGGYKLRTLLQQGQVSQVYEVVEVQSGRHFAMKILMPEAAADADHRNNLFWEADVGVQLAHENVIRVVKVIKDVKNPSFVMEYFPAGSLRARLLAKEVDFIKEKAHSIFRQAATGFAYMNAKGWVHRDIKPDNILVNSAGELKIIDFAISQKIPTGLGKMFYKKKKPQGTRSYMCPEQIRGEMPDPRHDIYSFGCTVYELTTGRPPFRGNSNQDLLERHLKEKPASPQIHNNDLTDDFSKLVLQMLAKKQEERPATFHDVLIPLRNMRIFKSQPLRSGPSRN